MGTVASEIAPQAEPLIIGVRHHSPACARVVAAQIRAVRPRHVLIEGPADFNARLDELYLPHRLPIAIYSFLSADDTRMGRRASWSPLAEHSPEWQALMTGREVGAQVNFIDLPAWHDAFADILNRYADATDAAHEARACAYEDALGASLAIEGRDSLWDHLFEDDIPAEELVTRLQTYFDHLRGDDPGSLGNQAREAMMARWIAWAMARNEGPVLVVCGGYHAPALQRLWRDVSVNGFVQGASGLEAPEVPQPTDSSLSSAMDRLPDEITSTLDISAAPCINPAPITLRFGSYLVPYHFKRLDALSGYASGMPSPAFHQWVWEQGLQSAGIRTLEWVLNRLRSKKLTASTADLMAVHVHAQALAHLRGHRWPLRNDWLDALAGALVKEALEVPLPWTYRGPLRAGTAPLLVEIMDVLAGDITGTLAPSTPQPPLVDAVTAELKAQNIVLAGELTLDLLDPQARPKSQLLHRLQLLDIPGIKRLAGPSLALSGERYERWHLHTPIEQRAALIEAASYGATLFDAARNRLEEILRQSPDGKDTLSALANALNRAAFAGLASLSQQLLADLQNTVGTVARFESLGQPLTLLHTLYLQGDALDMTGAPVLRVVIEAAFDRALWLLEANGTVATADMQAHLATFQALRTIAGEAMAQATSNSLSSNMLSGNLITGDKSTGIALQPERALAVWKRKATDTNAAAISRGASLGAVLSLSGRHSSESDADIEQSLTLLSTLSPPHMGDALMGLVALAREELTHSPAFIKGVDAVVQAFDNDSFVQALPSMRSAFAWLPAQERAQVATSVLHLHNATQLSRHALTTRFASGTAEALAHAAQCERYALEKLARWGIVTNANNVTGVADA